MSTVALIPARGGSKGIPGKNVRPFCGQPLIYWVCKAAQDCAVIDAVYVSTDDEEIASVARGLGLSKVQVIERDPATATDQASTESVMLDFAERVSFDRIVLLQATSPLLHRVDLDAGMARLNAGDCDSVLSVVRQTRFRWQPQSDGTATPANYDPQRRPRRQEAEGFLVENGAFYATTRERLLADGCRIGGRIAAVEMPEDTYFELDDAFDWTIAEGLMRRRMQVAKGSLEDRVRGLRLVGTDVDGCLTDSGMYYGEAGDELKKFSTRDGMGFELLRKAGYELAIITRENTKLVARRAAKLKVGELHQGAEHKVSVMEDLLSRQGLAWHQAAFLGDDIGDLGVLERVGLSACPSDALPEVRAVCDLIVPLKGGEGAFRWLAEYILSRR
jgi:N-acylneuraminate cytidylyltransferase